MKRNLYLCKLKKVTILYYMIKKIKKLQTILPVMAISILLFSSCLKKGDDTIVLPLPNRTIPYEIIPADVQDSLRAHGFTIHEGSLPPSIKGTFLASPMDLQYASDNYSNSFYDLYMTFAGQTLRNKITYSETQKETVEGTSIMANVIGEGDEFTMYCTQVITSRGTNNDTLWSCTTATVVSGTLTSEGFKDCQYSNVILDKWTSSDYYASQLPPIGTYRIWNDGDKMAYKIK